MVATRAAKISSGMLDCEIDVQISAGDSPFSVHTRSPALSTMPSALFQFNRMSD